MIERDAAPSEPPRPVRLSGGLIAFMAFMVLPALVAFAIVLGAWAVSDEVYAAERAPSAGAPNAPAVAAWKTTLVLICPIH
ncbi:MAG: hypothetical protein EXR68_07445 [Dehalococcoidia bacterium]|nr:hypothetical protein [Dehalococcoidia bacterium]